MVTAMLPYDIGPNTTEERYFTAVCMFVGLSISIGTQTHISTYAPAEGLPALESRWRKPSTPSTSTSPADSASNPPPTTNNQINYSHKKLDKLNVSNRSWAACRLGAV